MKIISNNQTSLKETAFKQTNLVTQIQARAAECETQGFFDQLTEIYGFAETLVDDRCLCRQCGRCCDQKIRPLATYAIEATYLVWSLPPDEIPVISADTHSCPFLNIQCNQYQVRALGCRLFLPWKKWSADGGCENYPHAFEPSRKIRQMLTHVEKLNHEFIWKTGLFRNLSFDFLAQWNITRWFEKTTNAPKEIKPNQYI